jgi:hypothetical protein
MRAKMGERVRVSVDGKPLHLTINSSWMLFETWCFFDGDGRLVRSPFLTLYNKIWSWFKK